MRMRGWWAATILAGIGLGAAGDLAAQGRIGGGPDRADRMAGAALRLAEELELTDAQRTRLEALRSEALSAREAWEREALEAHQELRARMRSAPQDDAEDREALRSEMRERMQALGERHREVAAPLDAQLQEILTAEQREELRALTRARRPGMHRGDGVRGRGGSGIRGRGVAPRGPAWAPDFQRPGG